MGPHEASSSVAAVATVQHTVDTDARHHQPASAALSPFSLQFADTALEAAWSASATLSLVAVDLTVCRQKLTLSSALFVAILADWIRSTFVGRGLWLAYVSALAGHLALMTHAPKLYARHRLRVILAQKLLNAACLTSFVPTFVLKPVDSMASYIEVVVLGAGLVMQLCTGVIMPVPWRLHVPLALATLLVYNTIMLRPLADVLMSSAAAVGHATAGYYTAVDDTAYTLSGLLMPFPLERPRAAAPRAQIYILTLWLQLQVFLASSLYLYYTESRARARFLRQQQQHASASAQPALASSNTTTTSNASISSTSSSITTTSNASASAPPASGQQQHQVCSRSPLFNTQAADCIEPSGQHIVLGGSFLALLMLLSWNVLHVCIDWLMPAVEGLGWFDGAVEWLAVQHGLAAGCFD